MRYFHITYFYKLSNGWGFGYRTLDQETYPNAKAIEKSIDNAEVVVILSINELSKSDYEDFIKDYNQ